MRRALRLALALLAAVTLAASGISLSRNPFAEPLILRPAEDAARRLEAEVRRVVTPEWLAPRIEEALAEGDLDALEMLLGLAGDAEAPIDPALRAEAGERLAERGTVLARAGACARCAAEPASCAGPAQLAACAIPFELSPLGDANALRRAAGDAASGREVDRVELSLALVGLGATAAVLATGGASAPVKAGAAAIRLARRMGALSPGLSRLLARTARTPIAWRAVPAYVAGRAGLDAVVDPAALAPLRRVAGDMGTVRAHTSAAEAALLLRHVDGPRDAARLARLAEARGPASRRTVHALGPARALRATERLAGAVWAALGLLAALGAQVLGWALWLLRRALRPRRPGRWALA